MQILRKCFQVLAVQCNPVLKSSILTSNVNKICETLQTTRFINTTSVNFKWLDHNKTFHPIQGPDEERRPAYVCHCIEKVKYSPKKMWYSAMFIRGMSIDEALKQLSFLPNKGSSIIKGVLLEAQKKAVEEHNVEFKSNLWVAESLASTGGFIKGVRRHAKARQGTIHWRYCNYYVRLEEGKPPKHYYLPYPKSGEEKLEDYMKQMRQRKVYNSL